MEINLLQIVSKIVSDGIQWQDILVFFMFFSAVVLVSLIVVSGLVKISHALVQCFTFLVNTISTSSQAIAQKKPARGPASQSKDSGQ